MSLLLPKDFESTVDVPCEGIRLAGEGDAYEDAGFAKLKEKDPRADTLLITAACIKRRIEFLAQEVSAGSKSDTLHILPVLTGGFIFAADLCRYIFLAEGKQSVIHPVRTSAYAAQIKGKAEDAREVRLLLEPENVEGKDIVIAEDLVDQGFTLSRLKSHLIDEKGAASVKICVLLNKQLENPTAAVSRLRETLTIDYVGFNIPDRWIAGYGIDLAGSFRSMPYIITVHEHLCKNEIVKNSEGV